MRLVADAQRLCAIRFELETNVVMEMLGLCSTRRNRVDVDIEDLAAHRANGREPRLFRRLTHRDCEHVRLAVCVPAELEPLAELAVMRQQHMRAVEIEHPGRSSDMSHA